MNNQSTPPQSNGADTDNLGELREKLFNALGYSVTVNPDGSKEVKPDYDLSTDLRGTVKNLEALFTAHLQTQVERAELNKAIEVVREILEHLKARPIQEHVEYLEAELMMMEAAHGKAKVQK